MSYSNRFHMYFIHIPKNAGTAICKKLGFYKGKSGHHKFKNMENMLRNKNTFCVCRNPYDRVVSIYEYFRMKKSYWHSSDNSTSFPLLEAHHYISNLSFKEFVKEIVDNYQKLVDMQCIHLEKQSNYVKDSKGNIGVKHVLRFENLNKELSTLLNKDIRLQKINVSTRDNWENYYDDDTKDMIYNFYKEDFDTFGYAK